MSAPPNLRHSRRQHPSRLLRTTAALALAAVLLEGAPAGADQWLVYVNGGLESIADKGWKERHGQVLFTQLGGTLVSVPFDDVDLATSAFITWQLGGRRRQPPRVAPSGRSPDASPEAPRPCIEARVLALRGGETLDVAIGERRETVHLACLDTPEAGHRFPQLAWFGRAALSWLEIEIEPGDRVCLTEHSPPLSDGDGHRIVYVRSTEGRDVTATVIEHGLGLVRFGPCDRAAEYSALESRAIAAQRGLWGPKAESVALAAVGHSGAAASDPPPRRAGGRRGGG